MTNSILPAGTVPQDGAGAARLAQKIKEADAASLLRPTISIRLRLVVGFLLCFFLSGAIAISTAAILYQVNAKLHFLETAESLLHEVEEARRFEKNYFLYGTDIKEALSHAVAADTHRQNETGNILEVAGEESLNALTYHLKQHNQLLVLCEQRQRIAGMRSEERSAIEAQLRDHGSKISELASALEAKERANINRMIRTSEVVPFVFLGILLLLIVFIVNFLARGFIAPLRRFQAYTRSIAEGDFSPIFPARPYRDEFSDLAIALNRMLIEIRTREDNCVEAAKIGVIGTLTSGVAHELNNPLNNIALTTEALMEGMEKLTAEQKWKLLQDIYFETERASETVKSLLDFTRQEKPVMVPLELAEVVQAASRLVQNEMALNNVTLINELPGDLPKVCGAANGLKQVFLNLFVNAIQAMPRGGKLHVSARCPDGKSIAVEVQDEGTGIPADVMPHIFEPFFTTKEPGKGTGLGLSVSYSIIKKHGGAITAESESGRGATFRVTLPVAPKA